MDIFEYLDNRGIQYERFEHPPVFTVEESKRVLPRYPGVHTKNLFLRDKKGLRHFLVVVEEDKRVDLKGLSEILGVSRLGFGSAEKLKSHLGVDPGSVTLLGLVFDTERSVELVVDQDIWNAELVQCHPLRNTGTLVVPIQGIRRFFESTGHIASVRAIPVIGD